MAGKDAVSGLMVLPEAAAKMGATPSWLSYIGTPNVDATVRDATALGAQVLKQAEDLPDGGRFAVLADPQGAGFGVFSPPPSPSPNAPTTFEYSWHELAAADPKAAMAFYAQLFGWTEAGAQDMGGDIGTYYMFGLGGAPLGGVYKKPAVMHGPPAWLAYSLVSDIKKSVEAIKKAGGAIVSGPMEVPGGDWIAVALDKQGAMFAVHARTAKAATPAVSAAKKAVSKSRPAKAKGKATKANKAAKKAGTVRKPGKKIVKKVAAASRKAKKTVRTPRKKVRAGQKK
jgi:predicted enzyme related to lactoylglutathione lyase